MYSLHTQCYLIALDIIDFKILFKIACKVSFENKTIEKINLYCIFHDPLVKAVFPNTCTQFDTPIVIYTLMKPVGYKILTLMNLIIILKKKRSWIVILCPEIVQVLHLWIKTIATLYGAIQDLLRTISYANFFLKI